MYDYVQMCVYTNSLSACKYVDTRVCVGGCRLPEVSVLAVHSHTGTIWTWAAGENRRREGGERENDKERKGHKER